MSKAPLLVLVDGSSYLFRAYYALPPLTNSQGKPTGAIYGVANMLKKLLTEHKSSHVAVVFDPKGKTFRHEFDSNYKANRTKMPEELAEQIPTLHELIRAMGFPLIIKSGYEADDVIGTLTKQAEAAGMRVLISTGDKDMAQLVSNHVSLINTMQDQRLDPEGVETKFGVRPDQIIDYLALVGDSSDNIAGIPKVGPKTAAKWLKQYQSIAELKKNADDIGGKVGEYLRENIGRLDDNQFLVTIKCDVPLDQDAKELSLQPVDNNKLIELVSECEFKSWLRELQSSADNNTSQPKATTKNLKNIDRSKYQIILTKKDAEKWFNRLQKQPLFAFDTETDSLDVNKANLVGFSLSDELGQAAYFPLRHDYLDAPQQLDFDWAITQLQTLLANKKALVIGQNLKYDLRVLLRAGITCQAKLFDTLLAAYVLNRNGGRLDLGSLAKQYLDYTPIEFTEVAGKGAKQLTFNQIDLDVAGEYAAEDADIALRLYYALLDDLADDKSLLSVFNDLDIPTLSILTEMESTGVLIDSSALHQQSSTIQKRLTQLEKKAFELADTEFNLNSPKQLREILFDKLSLPTIKKTASGQPSTNEEVLQQLSLDYPLPKVILEYRSLAKLKSTYTDKLPAQVVPETGRVHTTYNQAVTSTGRLSSNNPNLQNIPVRTESGRKIREAFIAPPGYKIMAADYSQIELRIIAHLSDDPTLLKAFADELDIHRATASEVFATPFAEVTDLQRRSAKAINFGLLYGMSAFGLAKQLNVGRKDAQTYLDTYFARYPKVAEYLDTTREKAAKQGYVETLYGRRVYLPDIRSKQGPRRAAAERAAINAPMQGTAADLMKAAMIAVNEWIHKSKSDARMIMQVHDELVFEVNDKSLDKATEAIRSAMCDVIKLAVPLVVDIGVGDNWEQAH